MILHNARYFGEKRIDFAASDVLPGFELGAALADQDGSSGNQLAAKDLYAQPLRVGITAVFGTS